jgi:hypothetical protein
MAGSGANIVLAWTERSGESSRVQAAVLRADR